MLDRTFDLEDMSGAEQTMSNRAGSQNVARFPPVAGRVHEGGLRADCQDCAAYLTLELDHASKDQRS